MTPRQLQNTLNELGGVEGLGYYYSLYLGVVTKTDDPDKNGRLCIKLAIGNGLELQWVEPVDLACGKKTGEWDIPAVGDNVHVQFLNGLVEYPRWAKVGFWKDGEKPMQIDKPEDYVRVFQNQIYIKASKENETYQITTPDGANILIDNKNKFVRLFIGNTLIETHNDGLIIKKGGNSLKNVLNELGGAVKDAQTFKVLNATQLNAMAGANSAGNVIFGGTLDIAAPLSPTTKNAIQSALDKIGAMFKE